MLYPNYTTSTSKVCNTTHDVHTTHKGRWLIWCGQWVIRSTRSSGACGWVYGTMSPSIIVHPIPDIRPTFPTASAISCSPKKIFQRVNLPCVNFPTRTSTRQHYHGNPRHHGKPRPRHLSSAATARRTLTVSETQDYLPELIFQSVGFAILSIRTIRTRQRSRSRMVITCLQVLPKAHHAAQKNPLNLQTAWARKIKPE